MPFAGAHRRRWFRWVLAGILALAVGATIGVVQLTRPAQPSALRVDLEDKLHGLRVVGGEPRMPGYDRSCSPGDGCVFGPAWSDDITGPDGHNGCDERNDVLRAQLRDVRLKPGTHDCVVMAGTLDDPYTGTTIAFERGRAGVEIDHVVPLAAAWRRGAATWSARQRHDFANDRANLIATTTSVNRSKSDDTPQDWRPPARVGWCRYADAFISVSATYRLAVTRADVRALRSMITTC